jgi:hypothetical protein
MVDDGAVSPQVGAVFPLAEARDAFSAKFAGGIPGRVVLTPSPRRGGRPSRTRSSPAPPR